MLKIEIHEAEVAEHSQQVFNKKHPTVFEELSCIMEIDIFCVMLRAVFGNCMKENFRSRDVFYKRRDRTKTPIKEVRFLELFKQAEFGKPPNLL